MSSALTEAGVDVVIFDCDGTLSSIEGIVELAKYNGLEDHIKSLTEVAMSSGGLSQEVFNKRLELIKPTAQQLSQLALGYYQKRTQNIEYLIKKLHKKGIKVYIFSAGITAAVLPFGGRIGVPEQQIYAVDLKFNATGNYLSYDRKNVLIDNSGKVKLIKKIFTKEQRIIFIGDGANDLIVKPYVKKFIGFGAHYYRSYIEQESEVYVRNKDALYLESIILNKFRK